MTPSGSVFRKPASSPTPATPARPVQVANQPDMVEAWLPEAPRQKSGLLRVFVWAFTGVVLLILLLIVVIVVVLYANPAVRGATLAKAQVDALHLASAVEQYQAHMGAPPATLAELTSPATNARGQTAGPYLAAIPRASRGFSDYRYERHADGHWTITTSGRDSCDPRIEATSGSSVTTTQTPFIKCLW